MPSRAAFSVKLLPANADNAEVDQALAILERSTPPNLRTNTEQIRRKIASPHTQEGDFYFAVLYRGTTLIGFAMFGYYPRCKLVVIDHIAIKENEREQSAFYVFVGYLIDEMQNLVVDYIAVEVALEITVRASGIPMMRLLVWVDFRRVEVEYNVPAMDTASIGLLNKGSLMLRSKHEAAQDFVKIRRKDLEEIVHSIYFDHYFPWYRDFLGERDIDLYKNYLEKLFREFKGGLSDAEYIDVSEIVKTSSTSLQPRQGDIKMPTDLSPAGTKPAKVHPDLIDAFIVITLAGAINIFLFWLATQFTDNPVFQKLPSFITDTYTAIWTSAVSGVAGVGAAIGKVLTRKPGAQTPNYLFYVLGTAVLFFVLVIVLAFLSSSFNQKKASSDVPSIQATYQICIGELQTQCPSGAIHLSCGSSVAEWAKKECSSYLQKTIWSRGGESLWLFSSPGDL